MSVESKKEQESLIEVLKQFPDEVRKLQNLLRINTAALAASSTGQNRGVVRLAGALVPITVNSVGFGGKVIFADDFESAINWTSGGTNAGANNSTAYSTAGARIYRGSKSLLIETTATTPLADHVANANRDIVLGKSAQSEMSCVFRADVDATNKYLMWQWVILPGDGAVYYPMVRYSSADSAVQYTANGTDWTDIISVNPDLSRWHYFSMSWDLTTKKYIAVRFDNQVWDGRGTAMRNAASSEETRAAVIIQIQNATTTQSQMNVDDFLVMDITESV